MKECGECQYFDGYEYECGEPICTYKSSEGGGYEDCPYSDLPDREKQSEIKCELSLGNIEERIIHTILNGIEDRIEASIQNNVSKIIEAEYKEVIKKKTIKAIDTLISEQINEYMKQDMVIGGDWNEQPETIKREDYLGRLIKEAIDKRLSKKDVLQDRIISDVRSNIERFEKQLKTDINNRLRAEFDEATRQTLTDGVVAMLMSNDTYMKLSNSMKKLIP